jgi:hypothetical protein
VFDRGLGLVSAGPAGRENLLSLIPRLIKQSVAVWWRVVGVAGWNTSAAWFEHVGALSGGRRRARTLLGPEETPVGVVLWSALGSAVLTRAWCSWWRCVGLGVVVC